MIEAARKHGPFDGRYAVPSKRAELPPHIVSGEDPLDWSAFSARFFPSSGRHDFEAVAAYAASSAAEMTP